MICGANNEERSGLQKCLTSLHFIAAAEGLSFFFSKFPGLVELGKCHGVQEIFSPKHQKKTATQITPTATQFNFRVAETAMQNFDSKFIPAVHHETVLVETKGTKRLHSLINKSTSIFE